MNLSKEDTFCEAMTCTAAAKASDNVLDFHAHGDDVMNSLFWSVFVNDITDTVDKDVVVKWETSDYETFLDGSGNASSTELFALTVDKANVVKGAYLIKNAPLPKGLKRYNRLSFTESTGTEFPIVTAFLHSGRDEGTPFVG